MLQPKIMPLTNFTIVLFGCTILGSSIYIYISTKPKKKGQKIGHNSAIVPGLLNLGNTCYLNALLQGLSACPGFKFWLESLDIPDFDDEYSENFTFLRELRTVILELTTPNMIFTCTASGIIKSLQNRRWIIEANTEHDLFELLNVFVTTWDEELACRNLQYSPSFSSISQMQEDIKISPNKWELNKNALNFMSNFVDFENRTRPPCRGLIATKFRCINMSCAFKKVRNDRFCAISLSIPKKHIGNALSLRLLVQKYFSTEFLMDANCDKCENKNRSGLLKEQGICQFPRCLIIRISRVTFLSSGNAIKQNEHVFFPEILDMSDFWFYQNREHLSRNCLRSLVKTRESQDTSTMELQNMKNETAKPLISEAAEYLCFSYKLQAVSEHKGRPESGHFITYRRGLCTNDTNFWFSTNDDQIHRVPYEQVADCQAYMLYYERL